MEKFHYLDVNMDSINLPERFTNPCHYTPHPLTLKASKILQEYLKKWEYLPNEGKMYGVLVVQNDHKEIGFLAAFSGNISNKNNYEYFVPPIYDLLDTNSFFKKDESILNDINSVINRLENSSTYLSYKNAYEEQKKKAELDLAYLKEWYNKKKVERDALRSTCLNAEDANKLIKESQFQKAEIKRIKNDIKSKLGLFQDKILSYEQRINELKDIRSLFSAKVQEKIFKSFNIYNSLGESKNLIEIFKDYNNQMPPAGSGECVAPRLLQYAFTHNLKPISMGEFWWGDSPIGEMKHNAIFYPACISKCQPILRYMLKGIPLDIEPNDDTYEKSLEVIYEDDFLLAVNKPVGLLSVPGRSEQPSVYQIIKFKYPDLKGPIIVHRLDMDTSGIMLLAKNKDIHKQLQQQFNKHIIKKVYRALLDGIVTNDNGLIELPLKADYIDRPRQVVCNDDGKYAITRYNVIKRTDNKTLIEFYPVTGRTHQLRVHSAHQNGLNAPIVGDRLYGKDRHERLCLHAYKITFIHPVTGACISLEADIPEILL